SGKALTKRSLKDFTWTIASWNVTHALVTGGPSSMFAKAPIKATLEGEWYSMDHGLRLSAKDFTITIEVHGKLAEKVEKNPHSQAFFRGEKGDDVSDVFKPLVEQLAK